MALYGIVNAERLNLRERPTTASRILRQLERDEALEVLRDAGFDWLEVQVLGSSLRGFVSKPYLRLTERRPGSGEPPPEGTPIGIGAGSTVEVTARALNVRSGPSTSAPILSTVQLGTRFEVLGRQGDWLRVRHQDGEAFIAAAFVKPATSSFTLEGFLIEEPELLEVRMQPEKLIPAQPQGSTEAAVARAWNIYGGLLSRLSDLLSIPVDVILGVLVAESDGAAFGEDGRMIIRFENHIFWRYWGQANAARFDQHFRFDRTSPARAWRGHQWRADAQSDWISFHGNQVLEWQVFEFARTLDETSAMLSISMGAPQIMGFNFKRLGYESVQQMFARFSTSAHAQIIGIFDFVKGAAATSPAIQALQRRDYITFTSIYNGSGNETVYADRIRRFAAIFNRLIGTAR
ncbi:MAG: N-acetylmuramidase domain-containing protein [Aggregatilineales bacterium]